MDEPSCLGCRALLTRIAELDARIRDLEAQLSQNASNSSMPPSANPPQAPPPVRKQPTGRKPGGQPGHTAHLRVRLPPERLTEPTVHYWPDICEVCQDDLPCAPGPDDPAEAQQVVQEAAAKNVDETGWKKAGAKRWLWGTATATVACVVIAPTRGALGLAAPLGQKIRGIICSDRWSVYAHLKLALRQ